MHRKIDYTNLFKKHWILNLVLVTCLGFIALGVVSCSGVEAQQPEAQEAATETPVPTIQAAARPTYLVQRDDVQEILAFSGRWLPSDQTQLAFQIAGAVRRVR